MSLPIRPDQTTELDPAEASAGPEPAASRELARAIELLRMERQHAEQMRLQLLNRLVAAEEEECRHLAREMHDQCGPDLTALRLQIERVKAASGEHAGLREQVEALDAIAARLDQDIDLLVWALRPTALDGLGLRAADRTSGRHRR
jgi:glucose-6-phosphate-specific signal transduction histidine kinase